MKTKQEKAKRLSRGITFLLALLMLMGPFSPILQVYAADAELAGGTPVVSIGWLNADGSLTTAGAAVPVDGRLTVQVSVEGGAADAKVDVAVSTFDLSASAAKGEYTPAEFKKTMSPGEKATFTVYVSHQRKYNDNTKAETVTGLNGKKNTKQLGVVIKSVSGNAKIGDVRYLRAHVNAGGGSFGVTPNTTLMASGHYDKGAEGEGYIAGGYTYAEMYTLNAAKFESDGFETKDDGKDPDTLKGSVKPYPHLTSAQKKLADYFDTIGIYFSVRTQIDDKDLSGSGGFTTTIRQGDNTLFKAMVPKGVNYDMTKINLINYSRYNTPTTDKTQIVQRRNSDTTLAKMLPVNGNDAVTIEVHNNATYYNKWFYKNYADIAISDNAAPVVREYKICNDIGYVGGDKIYMVVRFNKPVQVELTNAQQFYITTDLMDGNKDVGDMYFHYVDGAYTDTLIFEGTVPQSAAASTKGIVANSLRIYGWHIDRAYARVADMTLNHTQQNNAAVLPGKDIGVTLDCTIDTRFPKLSLSPSSQDRLSPSANVTVTVSEMADGGKLTYIWSSEEDRSKLPRDGWAEAAYTMTDGKATAVIPAVGFNGTMYLHVTATSKSGLSAADTAGPFRFDSTEPTVTIDPDLALAVYSKLHDLTVRFTDQYSEVSKVYLYLKTADGEAVENWQKKLVYDRSASSGNMLTLTKAEDGTAELKANYIGAITVTWEDLLEEGEYGGYFYGFAVEDDLGNRSAEPVYSTQTFMLDSRDIFETTTKAFYGDSEPAVGVDPQVTLDGTSIYYNKNASGLLTFSVKGKDMNGTSNYLYTVKRDGVLIYDYQNGGWLKDENGNPRYSGDFGFAGLKASELVSGETPAAPTDNGITVESVGETDGQKSMSAYIRFSEEANGAYEFIFGQDADKQSEILTFYVTSEDASPVDYTKFYNPERLLINRVWRFATSSYQKISASSSAMTGNYDTLASEQGAANPIFSSYEKAYEYAVFTEMQDIQVLRLTTSSQTVIDQLNQGGSNLYMKASGETMTAAAGQTWLRYKTQAWTPTTRASSSNWVYYYYGQGTENKINAAQLEGTNIGNALKNNAEEIANKATEINPTGGTYYLTKSNGALDANGEPTYSAGAIFSKDITISADRTIFAQDLVYTGDTAIYDSFIEINLAGETASEVPLVANHVFAVSNVYRKVYYRAYNSIDPNASGDWKLIEGGKSLREVIDGSGLYEFAEIGGGYRKYLLYCDFDAPVITYIADRGYGAEPETQFGEELNGTSYSASSLLLTGFVTDKNPKEGLASEYDKYCYFYLTSGRNAETFYELVTVSELNDLLVNSEEKGYMFSPGSFTIYIYDRLGNSITMKIQTNNEKIFEEEPAIKKNTSVTFKINRSKNEVDLERFVVTRDGAILEDVEYASELVFRQSGYYVVTVYDVYGMSASQAADFQRDFPEVAFYYKDASGMYVPIVPVEAGEDSAEGDAPSENVPPDGTTSETTGSASAPLPTTGARVEKNEDGTYYVSTAFDIRVAYNVYAGYVYEFTPTDFKHASSATSTMQFIDIPIGDEHWSLTIGYKDDPNKFIYISCNKDTTPPAVTATVSVPRYVFNETTGANNVLFFLDAGLDEIPVSSGMIIDGESVKFEWTDDSAIHSVTYILNGGAMRTADPDQNMLILSESGHYAVSVRDVLGNTTVFELTMEGGLALDVKTGKKTVEYSKEPYSHIRGYGSGATYDETTYAGQAIEIVMREEMNLTFAWSSKAGGADAVLYSLRFDDETLLSGFYADIASGNEAALSGIELGEAPKGTVFSDVLQLAYEYKNGVLTLTSLPSRLTYEFWQMRFTNDDELNPVIIQFERSNVTPNLGVLKTDTGEVLFPSGESFTGVDSSLRVTGVSDHVISVMAYRSKSFTLDFSDVSEKNTFDLMAGMPEGKYGGVEDEGYYMIVIANRYGNEQVMLVCIGYGLRIDVELLYQELPSREYSLSELGTYAFKTNKSLEFRVWDTKATVTLRRNNLPFSERVFLRDGYVEVKLDEVGEYEAIVKDEYGNTFTLVFSVRTPTHIAYNDFLIGFNPNALRKSEHYTNAPVSVSKARLDESGIRYVGWRQAGTAALTPIYDMISQGQLPYTQEGFTDCIGLKSGSYEVVFADDYGNMTSTYVHISTTPQLTVSRQTQSDRRASALSLDSVLQNGAWSNHIIRFENKAALCSFYVDGQKASFDQETNQYQLEFTPGSGEGSDEHSVFYVDEYGNQYEFTAHFYRKVPVVQRETTAEIVNIGSLTYVKGDFAYTWEDPKVFATYSLDNKDYGYQKSQILTEDGVYVIKFEDIAGNTASVRITRDTVVSYELTSGGKAAASGIAASGSIRVGRRGEELTVQELLINGEAAEISGSLTFTEHGKYSVTLSDPIGNTETLSFSIYAHPVQTFSYVTEGDYAISQVFYEEGGTKIPYTGGVMVTPDGKQEYTFVLDGKYEVELWNTRDGSYHSFKLTVDNVPPEIIMKGASEGGVTRENITFEGLTSGDMMEVWIDGKLRETHKIGSASNRPELSSAGSYKVVIRDEAGNEQIFRFTREFTTNTATNLMICMLFVTVSVGGTVFVRSREKLRTK